MFKKLLSAILAALILLGMTAYADGGFSDWAAADAAAIRAATAVSDASTASITTKIANSRKATTPNRLSPRKNRAKSKANSLLNRLKGKSKTDPAAAVIRTTAAVIPNRTDRNNRRITATTPRNNEKGAS